MTGIMVLGISCMAKGQGVDASVMDAYKLPEKTTQAALVKYRKTKGSTLRFFEKDKTGKWKEKWHCTAYVGKNGLGKKKAGDKKTPKGIYSLGQSFGIKKNPGTKMPYIKVNRQHYWCGDSYSGTYNQLIRQDRVKHRCRGEHLIDFKGVYNYAVFIDYNKKGKPKKGSAIFLHCMGRRKYTGGCVAIPEKYMIRLLRRLKPEAAPKIIIE